MPSWEEIVREHGPPIYRSAWKILRHAEDCEDCVQEVFIEAHKLYLTDKVTHWRTFLTRMVTFRALDQLRRRRSSTSLDCIQLLDKSTGPEAGIIEAEESSLVRVAIAELPEQQAAVFCLAHLDELTHLEIAKTLHISTNAVRVSLHKARARLRQLVDKSPKENHK
ncbi:MAG: sigma-70 family RNA polymerase sigma factor [Planctomycetales bacterium]|nr:sigma-70 family RNA polymerase sigma factor [Planctomycetales bacterium]